MEISLILLHENLKLLESYVQLDWQKTAIAKDIHIEPYMYTPDNLLAIERIANSNIFIDGQEWSYAKLLNINSNQLLDIYSNARPEGSGYFVAKTSHGDLIGFGLVDSYDSDTDNYDVEHNFKEWVIGLLAVDPNYRRFRVGHKLFDYIAQWVRDKAAMQGKTAESLYIDCLIFNKPACEAYRKWTNNNCKDDPEDNTTRCKMDLRLT